MFYLHVCLCTHCGSQKRLRSSGTGITRWVLRTSPRSSGRRARVLDYRALSSPLIPENRWTHLKLSKGHHPLNCTCSRQSIILLSLCAGTTATTRPAKFTDATLWIKKLGMGLNITSDSRVSWIPEWGSWYAFWHNLILSQVIGEVLGVGSRMKKLEAWSLVLYPSVP